MSLKIEPKGTIFIPDGGTAETLVAQLQPFTDAYLYVIDGHCIGWFNSLDEVRTGVWREEPASSSTNLHPEFYLRDVETDSLYAVFDEEFRNYMVGRNKVKSKNRKN